MKTPEEILRESNLTWIDSHGVEMMIGGDLEVSQIVEFMKVYSNQKLHQAANKSIEMIYDATPKEDYEKGGFIMRNFRHSYATPKQEILNLKDHI